MDRRGDGEREGGKATTNFFLCNEMNQNEKRVREREKKNNQNVVMFCGNSFVMLIANERFCAYNLVYTTQNESE